MIGVVERDEALRVLGGVEDAPGVVDGDELVRRSVEDKERSVQLPDRVREVLRVRVLEQLTADGEATAADLDAHLFRAFELGDRIGEQPGQLCRVERRADRDHRDRFGYLGGGGKDSGAAEAVSDEDLRGRVAMA